jgi:hypothetical protein
MAGRLSVMDDAFRPAKSQEDGLSSEGGAVFVRVLLAQATQSPGQSGCRVFNFDHRVVVRTWHLGVPRFLAEMTGDGVSGQINQPLPHL